MRYEATATIRIRVKYDPPHSGDNRVHKGQTEDEIEAVYEARRAAAEQAQTEVEKVAGSFHKDVKIVDILVEEVVEKNS